MSELGTPISSPVNERPEMSYLARQDINSFLSPTRDEHNTHMLHSPDFKGEGSLLPKASAAVVDATEVLDSLPTRAEIDALMQQNRQLLQLWRAEQSKVTNLKEVLNKVQAKCDEAGWNQDLLRRLENVINLASKHPEKLLSALEHEFFESGVVSFRDVVQIFVVDENNQVLVRGTNSEIPLNNLHHPLVRAYTAETVLWMMSNAGVDKEPHSKQPSSPSAHTAYQSSYGQMENTEEMADNVAFIPLLTHTSQNNSPISCQGVCKILFDRNPSRKIVGKARVCDLGRLGIVCSKIAHACMRHFQVFSSLHGLRTKESLLAQERVELVNFLRQNWNRLDTMFALRYELQEMVTKINKKTEESIIESMGRPRITNKDEILRDEFKIYAKGEKESQQCIASTVFRHLNELFGNCSVYTALYLPKHFEYRDSYSNMSFPDGDFADRFETRGDLGLVSHLIDGEQKFSKGYASETKTVTFEGKTMKKSTYDKYFGHPSIVSLVRYIASTGKMWNSATDSNMLDVWSEVKAQTMSLPGPEMNSLLCIPILLPGSSSLDSLPMHDNPNGLCCLGVLAIQKVSMPSEGTKDRLPHELRSGYDLSFDELDEHMISTYCKHLAAVLSRVESGYAPSQIITQHRKLLAERFEMKQLWNKTETIALVCHRLSVFLPRADFFRCIAEAAKTVCQASVAYLFLSDNNSKGAINDREVWTTSQILKPGSILSYAGGELATTVIGEALQTGKSIRMDRAACKVDPRCMNRIDGVVLNNLMCIPLYAQFSKNKAASSSNIPTVIAVLLVGDKIEGSSSNDSEKKLSDELTTIDMEHGRQLCRTITPLVQAWMHEYQRTQTVQALCEAEKALKSKLLIQDDVIKAAYYENLVLARSSTDPESVLRAVRSACQNKVASFALTNAKEHNRSSCIVQLIVTSDSDKDQYDDYYVNKSHSNDLSRNDRSNISSWKLCLDVNSKSSTVSNISERVESKETLRKQPQLSIWDRKGFDQAMEKEYVTVASMNDGVQLTNLYLKIHRKNNYSSENKMDGEREEPIDEFMCALNVLISGDICKKEVESLRKDLVASCCVEAMWLSSPYIHLSHASKAGSSWCRSVSDTNHIDQAEALTQKYSQETTSEKRKINYLLSACRNLFTCDSEKKLAIIVRNQFKHVLPGHAVLLQTNMSSVSSEDKRGKDPLKDGVEFKPSLPNGNKGSVEGSLVHRSSRGQKQEQTYKNVTMWSCIPMNEESPLSSTSSVTEVQVTLTEAEGQIPRGITGSAVKSGEDIFISDMYNNKNFQSDVDLNSQLVQHLNNEFSSTNWQQSNTMIHGIACLPLVNNSGEIIGCLQVYQNRRRKRNSKLNSVFSRDQKQLWKAFASCLESVLSRLRFEKSEDERTSQRNREHASLKSNLERDQSVLYHCVSIMKRVQTEESAVSYNDTNISGVGSRKSAKISNLELANPLSIISSVQLDLEKAFKFSYVGVFASERGAISGDNAVWTSTASRISEKADHSANYTVCRLSSACNRIRELLGSTSSRRQAHLIQNRKQVEEILNEMPQISSQQAYTRQNKIVLALSTQVIGMHRNKSGARGLILAVGDSSNITPNIASTFTNLCLPVLNSIAIRVSTQAMADNLKFNIQALSKQKHSIMLKNDLLLSMESCRKIVEKDGPVQDLIITARRLATKTFNVEATNIFLIENSNKSFWTLDVLRSGETRKREVAIDSGSIIGRFRNIDLPFIPKEMTEPVCMTTDLQQSMGHGEIPEDVNDVKAILLVAITVEVEDKLKLIGVLELINPIDFDQSYGNHFSREDLLNASAYANSIGQDFVQLNKFNDLKNDMRLLDANSQDMKNTHDSLVAKLNVAAIQQQTSRGVLNALSTVRAATESKESFSNTFRQGRPNRSPEGLHNDQASSNSIESTTNNRYVSICKHFVKAAQEIFGGSSLCEFFIFSGKQGSVSFTSKGLTNIAHDAIPDAVKEVFRSSDAMLLRRGSSSWLSSMRSLLQRDASKNGSVKNSKSTDLVLEPEGTDNDNSGISCFPVYIEFGIVLGCLYVEHHLNSSAQKDYLACYSSLHAFLLTAANTILDIKEVLKKESSIKVTQSEHRLLLLSSGELEFQLHDLKLSKGIADVCIDILSLRADNNANYGNIIKSEFHLQEICTRVKVLLEVDRVFLIYGKTAAASEEWVSSTADYSDYKGMSSLEANSARSEASSKAGMNAETNVSAQWAIDDGTSFRVVADEPKKSEGKFKDISTGHILDRSSILIRDETIVSSNAGLFVGTNANVYPERNGPDSKLIASNLTLSDLKRELGKDVTTGAIVASFSHSTAQGMFICLCRENKFGHSDSTSSERALGSRIAPLDKKQVDKYFSTEFYIKLVKNLAASSGLLCENLLQSQQTELSLARAEESQISLTQQLDDCSEKLNCSLAKVTKLSKIASTNESTMSEMQTEIKMMEKHLQNEIESRMRGDAVRAMGHALSLWRQTSIQWYFKTWKANSKRARRYRYIVTRVTYKMHRGLVNRFFYLWTTIISEHLRHKRVIRRSIERIKHLKLYRSFHSWIIHVKECKVYKTKVRQAYTRLSKSTLTKAVNMWCDVVFRARRARRALKHWLKRLMTLYFNTWSGNTAEIMRQRNISYRVVKRFQRLKLAAYFASWIEWHDDLLSNRDILRRAACRMSHLKSSHCFARWNTCRRQRVLMRSKLKAIYRIFHGKLVSRMRSMWMRWYLHVHLSAKRIKSLKIHATAFVQKRDLRTLRYTFACLSSHLHRRQKARKILERLQSNSYAHGMRSAMWQWQRAAQSIKEECLIKKIREAEIELDDVAQKKSQQFEDMQNANSEAMLSLQHNLAATEDELRHLRASRNDQQLQEVHNMRRIVKEAMEKQKSEKMQIKQLQESAAILLKQFQAVKQSISRAEDDHSRLKQKISSSSSEIISRDLQPAVKTSAYIGQAGQRLSENEIYILKQKVSLLVSSSSFIEPRVLLGTIHKIIFAAGARDNEHAHIFQVMFSEVLEQVSLRRANFEKLRKCIQSLITQEIKIGRINKVHRPQYFPQLSHIENLIEEATAKTYDDNEYFDIENHIASKLGSVSFYTGSVASSMNEAYSSESNRLQRLRINNIVDCLETTISKRRKSRRKESMSEAIFDSRKNPSRRANGAHAVLRAYKEDFQARQFSNLFNSPSHAFDSQQQESIEMTLKKIYLQMESRASTIEQNVRKVIKQEIRSLDTELIVADEHQLESYKQSVQQFHAKLRLWSNKSQGKNTGTNTKIPIYNANVIEAHLAKSISELHDRSLADTLDCVDKCCLQFQSDKPTLILALQNQLKITLMKCDSMNMIKSIFIRLQELCKTLWVEAADETSSDEDSSNTNQSSQIEKRTNQRLLVKLRQVREKCLAASFTFKFRNALSSGHAGQQMSQDSIRLAFDNADTDGNGSLDKSELGDLMTELMGSAPTTEGLDVVFSLLDLDGSGDVDFEEFASWLKSGSGNVDMNSKIQMETHLNRFIDENSGQTFSIELLQLQLGEVIRMMNEIEQNSEQTKQREKAQMIHDDFDNVILYGLVDDICDIALSLHNEKDMLVKKLEKLRITYGKEPFNEALERSLHRLETDAEEFESQRQQMIDAALRRAVGMIKDESKNIANEAFARLSTLEHNGIGESNGLIFEELQKSHVDLNELHKKSTEQIRLLEEQARSYMDAFSNFKDFDREESPHYKRRTMTSESGMKTALMQTEGRLEKMELKYERAVDHIRHMHEVIRERRKKNQIKLSQLLALETVYLGSEGVATERMKTQFDKFHQNATVGRRRPVMFGQRAQRRKMQRLAMSRLSSSKGNDSHSKSESLPDGSLLESTPRASFVRGAVVHLWGAGL